jgi:murein DD-endopeptidase MepM/ murein hydrolase activator NlpD
MNLPLPLTFKFALLVAGYSTLVGLVLPANAAFSPPTPTLQQAQPVAAQERLYYAPMAGTMTSPYGYRADPITGEQRFHAGLDIAAPEGTPVHAADKGLVLFAQEHGGYGNVVVLKHMDGMVTLYAHNATLLVRKGEWVETGDPIALSGATGRVTGPHLHFEVHFDQSYVDPKAYLLYRQRALLASKQVLDPTGGQTQVAKQPLSPALVAPKVMTAQKLAQAPVPPLPKQG